MPKLDWIDSELQNLHDAGLYNNIRTLGSEQGAWLDVDGRRVLNFCSNNYLGLANHPRLKRAVVEAMDKYGVGPGAVRTIAGTMDLHVQFDERMAKFKGVEAAISLQSGFTANLAVIPALVGQFISLFKDTTLVVIVGINDFLGIGRSIINSNPDFVQTQLEVYLFIAVVYWVFSYLMSLASRRLESALGVESKL